MSACNELKKLLDKAGVIPFRRVGRVRAVFDPRAPCETLDAALTAIRQMAGALAEELSERPAGKPLEQHVSAGLQWADVCDDPHPRGVDPARCPVEWLVARAARYHFRIDPAPPDDIRFEALDGWNMRAVTPYLPAWFVAACKARRAEIVAHVNAAREFGTAPDDSEGERARNP